jgi:hypothetical protein
MIPQTHSHGHDQRHEKHTSVAGALSGLHRDWRTWLVIGLMLAAIGTYVLTLDDSIQPASPGPIAVPGQVAPPGGPGR